LGLRFPYKVSRVSEALGVCRTDIVNVEVAASDCGAPAMPITKEIERRKIFTFIVR
jgi:hypothetical protein